MIRDSIYDFLYRIDNEKLKAATLHDYVFMVGGLAVRQESDYIRSVVDHKVAVYEAGMEIAKKIGLDGQDMKDFEIRLIVHDLSKFSEAEANGYENYNFGGSKEQEDAFERAWLHHKNFNDHHPEHWHSTDGRVLEMPKLALYEMVADWMGEKPLRKWLNATHSSGRSNLSSFIFHPTTAKMLAVLLTELLDEKYVAKNNRCLRA